MGTEWLFLLPVLWAGLAAGVALLLYRTSGALIEGDSLFGLPVKGVRLTGSVVIFLVAFYAVNRATTDVAALRADPSRISVAKSDVERLGELSQQVDSDAVDIAACPDMNLTAAECGRPIAALRVKTRDIQTIVERMNAGADPADHE